jgi:hypothetical protein
MTLLDRNAGASITWVIDGSWGWGYLMDHEQVLDGVERAPATGRVQTLQGGGRCRAKRLDKACRL